MLEILRIYADIFISCAVFSIFQGCFDEIIEFELLKMLDYCGR